MKKVQLNENYTQPARPQQQQRPVIRENFSMKSKKSWMWIIIIILILAAIVIGAIMLKRHKKEGMAVPVPMSYGRQKFGFRFY